MRRKFFLFSVILHSTSLVELKNTTDSRPKRFLDYQYLVFPEGSNVQLVYCMTIATLSKPTGKFTMGATAGIAYELPNDRIDPLDYRRPELYHRRSRRSLYRQLESMLKTRGLEGCLLKALCQAGKRNREAEPEGKPGVKGSFLAEILHAVFTFPPLGDHEPGYDDAYSTLEDCDQLYDCRLPTPF